MPSSPPPLGPPDPADPDEPTVADAIRPSVGALVHRRAQPFDEAVDRLFDRIRGHSVADRIFYTASELGDFSLIWHILGTAKALGADDPLRATVRNVAILSAESMAVNWGIKSLFRRDRPIHEHEHPHHLRRPRTSSFPSGHASAAFVAAGLLSEGSRLAPVYYATAVVVAASRIHVRIHHGSDVVVGAAIGVALGSAARRVYRR